MNCTKFQKFAAAFADGELDVEQNLQALEHLNICPDCTRQVATIQQLKTALRRTLSKSSASAELRSRVIAAIAQADAAIRMEHKTRIDGVGQLNGSDRIAGRLWTYGPVGLAAAMLLGVTLWQVLPLYSYKRGMMTLRNQTLADIREQHVFCSDQADQHHDESLGRTPALVARRLGRQLHRSVLVPDLDAYGLSFLGAKACPLCGRPSGHALYRSGDRGTTLSVFSAPFMNELNPSDGRRIGNRDFYVSADKGSTVVAWHERNESFIVCGSDGISDEMLMTMAESVRTAVRGETEFRLVSSTPLLDP